MSNRYEVVLLKGTQPEKFQIRWVDAALQPGGVYNASEPLLVDELRAKLESMGRSKPEIDELIEQTKKNSV